MLRAEYEEKERAMKAAHESELAALRASLGQASSDEIERLKAKHADEIKELSKSHEKLIAQLNANFDKQIAQKEQDHVDTIKQIEKSHEEAIEREKTIQANLEAQIRELMDKIVSLENELSQT